MHKSILLAALLIGACGGDDSSGVSSSKQLKDLSDDERMQECEWGIAYEGGAGHQTMCGNDLTVTVHSVDECVGDLSDYAAAGCTATVEQLEACTRAFAADPCSFGGDACGPILECM